MSETVMDAEAEAAAFRWLMSNGGSTLREAEAVSAEEAVLAWLLGRPMTESLGEEEGEDEAEGIGDGSPFVSQAVEACWQRCQELQRGATSAQNPNSVSAARIRSETGTTVDANPYHGLTRVMLEAVVRAAFNAHQPPEVLLALWAKEGSHRMVTTARLTPAASTAQNARTIFRSRVYYEDLGADHFIVTTRQPGGDNVWDSRDSAAAGHETHFAGRIRDLVSAGVLSEDISGAINGELTASASRPFSVQPSTKFYALSLLLVDALFTQMQRNSFPQLTSLSAALNYLQWNMGTASFRTFLESADRHRREPRFLVDGQPITVEQWALHTAPAATEYRQARVNGIRFLHYQESYRPIFATAMNLITPGIEDLALPRNMG